MTYAYLRQMPNCSNLSQQQRNILSFALTQGLQIDKEVIEYSTKNRPIEEREEFEKFLHSLNEGEDMIVVEHLAILSDGVEELVKVINCMLSREIVLYIANTGTVIKKEAVLVDVFPLLNDLREAQKAKTGQIGRPKGSRSSSKFDVYQPQIISLLKEGKSVSAIARELGVSRSSLKDYIESRGIRELVEGSWMEISSPRQIPGVDNTVLICPFEQDNNNHNEERI
ncbi:recombinase family protein [Sulfurovum sp. ST-21]|uniref:Recombinase family protein n=1 Tax=Sulfurovum indicum TaxID=2779528 RepID=A0A7M1S335_9BACT|nr:recombinase family protein [Sulfurovum indicum]QOR61837.1 recombinase family protein [Sulfurovum indicum]